MLPSPHMGRPLRHLSPLQSRSGWSGKASPHLNHLNSQLPSPKAQPSPCPLVGAGYPLPCRPVAEWASLLQVSPCPPRRGSQILLRVCGVTNGGSAAGLISLGLPPLCNSGRPTAFSAERASGPLLEFAISVRGAQGDQLPSPA